MSFKQSLVITCGLVALSMPTWAMSSRNTQEAAMDYRKEVLGFIPWGDGEGQIGFKTKVQHLKSKWTDKRLIHRIVPRNI